MRYPYLSHSPAHAHASMPVAETPTPAKKALHVSLPVVQSCPCKCLQVLPVGVAARDESAVMRGKQTHTLAGQGVQLRMVGARGDGEAEGTTWVVANLQQTTGEKIPSDHWQPHCSCWYCCCRFWALRPMLAPACAPCLRSSLLSCL